MLTVNVNVNRLIFRHGSIILLGIYLDEKLSLVYHVEIVSSKVTSSLYGLCKVKRFLPRTSLRFLYFAKVHSH